jgi:hypothetical protein
MEKRRELVRRADVDALIDDIAGVTLTALSSMPARRVAFLRSVAASSGSCSRCAPKSPTSVSRRPTRTVSRHWTTTYDDRRDDRRRSPSTDRARGPLGRSLGSTRTSIVRGVLGSLLMRPPLGNDREMLHAPVSNGCSLQKRPAQKWGEPTQTLPKSHNHCAEVLARRRASVRCWIGMGRCRRAWTGQASRKKRSNLSRIAQLTNGLPSRTNVCTRRKRTCGPKEKVRV